MRRARVGREEITVANVFILSRIKDHFILST